MATGAQSANAIAAKLNELDKDHWTQGFVTLPLVQENMD